MDNLEFEQIWNQQSAEMEGQLEVDREMALQLSRADVRRQMRKLYRPKWTAIFLGVPYTLLLVGVTFVALMAQAYLVAFGFGAISLIMLGLLLRFGQQIYLIRQVRNSGEILATQALLSKLRISSVRSLHLAVFQLPFWVVCWVSIDALRESPFVYGGINLLVFLLLGSLAYWLYRKLDFQQKDSKVRDFFLSGREWDPMVKSAEILEQVREYRLEGAA